MFIIAKQVTAISSQIELGIYRDSFAVYFGGHHWDLCFGFQHKLDSGTATLNKTTSASTSLRTGISS